MTEKAVIEPGWVTTQEAAEKTGYNPAYCGSWRAGELSPARVGRDWFVNLAAALEYRRAMDALGSDKHNPWRDDREDLAQKGRGRGGEQ
jgi:hypothetical protein